MADKSKIEWTDATWNPVTGCTKVSAGCKNCYAERVAHRFGWDFGMVELHLDRMGQPLRWARPRRVFVCSTSDLFHKDVPYSSLVSIFATMAMCTQHVFQVLTKRPERMREFVRSIDVADVWRGEAHPARLGNCNPWPLPNVWLGVSVEDQASADERLPVLIDTPAAVKFVSVEPMLGPVDLGGVLGGPILPGGPPFIPKWVDWVICGGESGPGARPMHPDWARGVRDQCKVAGVPFFFKQWGEWSPCVLVPAGFFANPKKGKFGYVDKITGELRQCHDRPFPAHLPVERRGKANTGRLLDGVLHDEYPASVE